MPAPPPRTLVTRGGALGDFIVALPAIARAASGRVALACNPRFAGLLPDPPDEVIDLGGLDALWLFGGPPPPALPDRAVVFTPGVADRLRELGVLDVVDASAPIHPGRPAHVQLWQRLGPGTAPAPRLIPRRVEPGRPLVIAPGAGGAGRRWPGMEALVALLAATDLPWCLVPGLGEVAPPRLPARPDLDLDGLVALAAGCAAWLGNDTGTTHLASAAGAPVVAMFGPTDPSTWAPPGATVLPFETPPADVLRALRSAAR